MKGVRREWLVKTETIYQAYLARLANLVTHRREMIVIQKWLLVVPRSTRVLP